MPVDKAAGSPLYAGTVNLNGRLVMRVTATGEANRAGPHHRRGATRPDQPGEHPAAGRPRQQRVCAGGRRRGAGRRTVVGAGARSARRSTTGWRRSCGRACRRGTLAAAFITAAAVLIVACPCAMGLATPAAIMAGSNAAAQRGILIRDGVALEKAGEVTAVIFDKTGTLTAGQTASGRPGTWQTCRRGPAGSPVRAAWPRHWRGIRRIRSARRLRSSATSEIDIAEWAGNPRRRRAAKVSRFEASGQVQVRLTGSARLGSLALAAGIGRGLSARDRLSSSEWSAQGATIVGLAVEKSLRGLFAIQDTLKPGAARSSSNSTGSGLKTYLVTGDNALTAASIARQAGDPAENVFAEVRPEQKAELVKKLQAPGRARRVRGRRHQ